MKVTIGLEDQLIIDCQTKADFAAVSRVLTEAHGDPSQAAGKPDLARFVLAFRSPSLEDMGTYSGFMELRMEPEVRGGPQGIVEVPE